jgi:hypothetical protein
VLNVILTTCAVKLTSMFTPLHQIGPLNAPHVGMARKLLQ